MKNLIAIFIVILILQSCSEKKGSGKNHEIMQKRFDSLSTMIAKIKPGLGEIMTGIQLHHEKLWFAGTEQNWKLADFEIGEIKESVEQAEAIETDRPETKTLVMIKPVIDSLAKSISDKDLKGFKRNYTSLTNTCNSCHTLNHFEFNVIKVPTTPPVSDQEFAPGKN